MKRNIKKYHKQDFKAEIQTILAEIGLPDRIVADKMWQLEGVRTNRFAVLRYRLGKRNPQSKAIMQRFRNLRDKLKSQSPWTGENRRSGDRRQSPRATIIGEVEGQIEPLRIVDFLSNILKAQGETQEMLRQVLDELQKKELGR